MNRLSICSSCFFGLFPPHPPPSFHLPTPVVAVVGSGGGGGLLFLPFSILLLLWLVLRDECSVCLLFVCLLVCLFVGWFVLRVVISQTNTVTSTHSVSCGMNMSEQLSPSFSPPSFPEWPDLPFDVILHHLCLLLEIFLPEMATIERGLPL